MRMILPRGKAVREGVNPGRIDLGAALETLKTGSFSGYLHFHGSGGPGFLLYRKGMLIEALWQDGDGALRSLEAIRRIFAASASGGLTLDVYRMDEALSASLCALFHGDLGRAPESARELDPETLLETLRSEALSGFLRVYTEKRCTLIQYRKGRPVGFVNDGEAALSTKVDLADSVAKQPGAQVDFVWTPELDQAWDEDLSEALDLRRLWEKTTARTT